MDPDEFIRSEGVEAFKEILDNALPLFDFMWMCKIEGIDHRKPGRNRPDLMTPDGRARLEREMLEQADRIPDDALKAQWKAEIYNRMEKFFGASSRPIVQPQPDSQRLVPGRRQALRVSTSLAHSPLVRRDYRKRA